MLRTTPALIHALGAAFAGGVTALAADLPAAGAESGSWMLVLPAGTLQVRDGRGPFIAGGVSELQGIVARTKKRLGTTELMVDYDHQAHFGAVDGVGGRAPAAGWVKELKATPEGIQARIEWTAAAKAAIAGGEYRYLSPLFTTDARNRVDVLLNVALVNMPALDLEAVAARAKPETDMDKFAKAAGLAADAGEDAILARITALAQISTAVIVALGLKAEATADQAKEALSALTVKVASVEAIALAAGLDKSATGEAIAAAVKTAKSGGSEAAVTALKAELTTVAGELKALKQSNATEKATAFVDGAIREGRVGVKALRDHYVTRHAASAEGAEQVETEITALPTLGTSGALVIPPAAGKDGAVALTDVQKTVARQLGIAEKDYAEQLKKETA